MKKEKRWVFLALPVFCFVFLFGMKSINHYDE